MFQSLDSILRTIISTFDPNTGTYQALENPTLSKIFGTIVEMSGVPISFNQLKQGAKSTMQPQMGQTQVDQSAVQPLQAQPQM
jgi:hypothetical protein